MNGSSWNAQEDATLRSLYPSAPREEVLAALPGRPWSGVVQRACKLKILRAPRWSPEDEAALRDLWPDGARRTLCRKLRRTWDAIKQHAEGIGLAGSAGAPSARWAGYVTVTKAARIAGFELPTFRRILAAYHKHFLSLPADDERAALPSPVTHVRGALAGRRQEMVDEFAARDAVAWWLSLEASKDAAARLGLPYMTLHSMAVRAGEPLVRGARRSPEAWDALVAAQSSGKRFPHRTYGPKGEGRARPGVVRATPRGAAARKAAAL